MDQFISDRDPAPGRWGGMAVWLVGLFTVWTLGAAAAFAQGPPRAAPVVADVAQVDPDADAEPIPPEEIPLYVPAALPDNATEDELRDLRAACTCLAVGSLANPYSVNSAFRGNLYRLDAAGAARTLCRFKMQLNAPAGTALCFYVYKCSASCSSATSSYVQVWSRTITAAAAGMQLYDSGEIVGVQFQPGEKFALGVAWGDVTVGYGRDSTTYPIPAPSFGTIEGSFGLNSTPCPVASPKTLQVYTGGAYAQEICFKPPPGACCSPQGTCTDTTATGDPMDYDTCLASGGEFTEPGFTCTDLGALGGCGWLDVNQGACCWGQDAVCSPVQSGDPMNPFLCEYLGELYGGGTSAFHRNATCASEICHPRGACCLFGGDCRDYLTETECLDQLGGVTWYDPIAFPNITCQNATCPAEGACCLQSEACEEHSATYCQNVNGTYWGDGVHCDAQNLICRTVTGACCYTTLDSDNCIDPVTQYYCEVELGGTYKGDYWQCSFTQCPRLGACCDGPNCQETTFDACTNGGVPPSRWFEGTSCDPPAPCLPPGACCVGSECHLTNLMECDALGGTFTLGGVCDPNPCPQPGACCMATGCALKDQIECVNSNGDFAGVGVPCGWVCNLGACCSALDPCAELTQMACLTEFGEFAGALSICGGEDAACLDCNSNGVLDATDIAGGTSQDCIPRNGIPDECDIASGTALDCNSNGIPDGCDIASGFSRDCNANGIPGECEAEAFLCSATPPTQGTLWRSAHNVIRLTFDAPLTTPTPGQIRIEQLLPEGAFGPDMSTNGFAFTVENDGGNRPRILKIQEPVFPTPSVLTHRTWYAIRNIGEWTGVTSFEIQYLVQMGDVNNDGKVLANDLSAIFPKIPTNPAGDQERADINGDAKVLANDLSAVFPRIPSNTVTKPSGH